jgi:hypothetical protein
MKKNFSISKNNNITFGILFFIFFLIIGLYPAIAGERTDIKVWSIFLSLLFLIITIIKPNLFTFPNRLWIQFGILLGKIISPIIMFLVFFLIVTPTGNLIRIFGKDAMRLKKTSNNNVNSYWINRVDKFQSMREQF